MWLDEFDSTILFPLRERLFVPMSDVLHVDLTKQERELLLRGLRYVRSSVLLEIYDPEDAQTDRAEQLREIESLVAQLNGQTPSSTKAAV